MSRRSLLICGQVQGVGFRPFVCTTARHYGLSGYVRNRGGAVHIEVEGPDTTLDEFVSQVCTKPPVGSRIESIACQSVSQRGEQGFAIVSSDDEAQAAPFVPPDVATCSACLTELFEPGNRRFGHPFLSCPHCGPRWTIIQSLPFDRERTSLSPFPLCTECRREFEDPQDRRFHAQATACPHCGPQLVVHDGREVAINCNDLIATAAEALRAGKIVAVKGLGGYHMTCDARNSAAVARLRKFKHREAKPFAVMTVDVVAARLLCRVSPEEAALLESPSCPIVLLRRHSTSEIKMVVADAVFVGSPELGIMLPYTPLHHLLIRAVDGMPLVMTSGNRSDEPITIDDREAIVQFAPATELFLTHDRPIVVRCDDSVVRVVADETLPIRRSRGYAPESLKLPIATTRPLLAVGGQQKATFTLVREQHAYLSQDLGDLDSLAAHQAYVAMVEHGKRLFGVEPELIVHDLHPDYASTRYAHKLSAGDGTKSPLPRLAVQHHHAHLASCLAEHGRTQSVIGVIFDGTGYGLDGAAWGGEFLVGDAVDFQRAAHFRYVPLPGGEQAVREPWRMAVSQLLDAGVNWRPAWRDVDPAALAAVRRLTTGGTHAPPTSSVGRLFDAVAALLDLRTHAHYEGQAAMELEWTAAGDAAEEPFRFDCISPPHNSTRPLEIDVRPLIADLVSALCQGCPRDLLARQFHATLIAIIAQVCERLREQTGLQTVALSGGCFLNVNLLRGAIRRLEELDFEVLRHRKVPPSDGGLAFGQAAIAVARQSCENPSRLGACC